MARAALRVVLLLLLAGADGSNGQPFESPEELVRRGESYQHGIGVDQDDHEAASLYRRAAARGSLRAKELLVQLLLNGRGFAEGDWHDAQRELTGLLLDLSAAGQPRADLFLGLCYQQGRGVRKDLEESAYWYRRAARAGIADAQRQLDELRPELESFAAARAEARELNRGPLVVADAGGGPDARPAPRLVVQLGHTRPIVAVAVSADGELVATAGGDQVIVLWHLPTAREIYRLAGSQVRALAFSPDGRHLLAGGEDGAGRLWEVRSGTEVRRLVAHHDVVTTVLFAPGGELALTGSLDGTAILWRLETGEPVRKFDRHPVTTAAFSGDGTHLVTGGWDGTARLWRLDDGEELAFFGGHAESLQFVAVDPATGDVLTAGRADPLRRFDSRTGAQKAPQTTESIPGGPGALAPARSTLAIGDAGVVDLWDLATGTRVGSLAADFERVTSLAFTADGRSVVTAGIDGKARLWDVAGGTETSALRGLASPVTAVDFAPGGDRLLAGAADGRIRLWSVDGGGEEVTLDGHRDRVVSAAFHPTLPRVASRGGSFDSAFRLWDLDRPGAEPTSVDFQVTAWADAPDGRHRALGGSNLEPVIRLVDGVTGEEIRRLAGHGDGLASLSFSADGELLASGSFFRGDPPRLWDLASGREIARFDASYGAMVALSPDGRRLVTGSLLHLDELQLWDTASAREIARLPGTFEAPKGADFSPDSRSLVTTGPGETARIWDAATGRELRRLEGHTARVTSVVYSPDGRRILTGSEEGAARLWDAASGRELASLVSFDDGSWAVLRADGRFDTNNLEALEGLHWLLPEDPLTPLPVEIFLRDYYEPRLLPRILAGEDFAPVPDLAELNRVQPEVAITAIETDPEREDRVSITVEVASVVAERESGVFDLRLFRDGQLVGYLPESAGAVPVDPATRRARLTVPGIRLPRDGRPEVLFSAYAFNRDRVKSATARRPHAVPPSLERRPGRAFVVTVGVNAYDDPAWNLAYAAADARRFGEVLESRLERSGRFSEVRVVPLISDRDDGAEESVPHAAATKANVRAALDRLAGRRPEASLAPSLAGLPAAQPEDLVLLTFSSHGWVDREGEFYLFPSDIGAGDIGAPKGREVTPGLLARTISTRELSAWLRDVDAGELVLIVDACHSAATVEREGFKPGPMGSRGLGQLAYDKGMRVLSASQADSLALESELTRQGLLTYALVRDGLEAGRADFAPADRRILLGEWLRYATRRVPELYEEIRHGRLTPVAAEVAGRGLGLPEAAQPPLQQPSLFDFARRRPPLVLDGPD